MTHCCFHRMTTEFLLSSVTQSCPTFCDPMDCSTPASLFITNPQSLLKLRSNELVMPSNHFISVVPFFHFHSFPASGSFFNESVLQIRWPKHWSFSFSISLSNNIQYRFLLGWTGWISLQSKGLSRFFSNTTVQKH